MKKLILITALFAVSAPLFAQQTFYEGFIPSATPLFRSLQRAISRVIPEEKAPWINAVKKEEHMANSNGALGTSFHGFPARKFEQAPVQSQSALYTQRLHAFQALTKNNHTLQGYTFHATRPEDLISLTSGQVLFLTRFFTQPMTKKGFNTLYTPAISHPKAAETELSFTVEGKKLILLINSRPEEKKIYFFTGSVPGKTPVKRSTAPSASHGRVINGHLVPSF